MKKLGWAISLGFLWSFAWCFGATNPELSLSPKLAAPEIETLPNGLKLVWFEDTRFPVVDLMVLVKSGYRDDPMGKTGTAELVSRLLDRGAGAMSAAQISKAIEMLGASRNATADDDTLTVGIHGLAPDAPALLEILGKIVIQPEFSEPEVKRQQTELIERWNLIGDYGDNLASLVSRRILTSGTTYARGDFFSLDEFKKITTEDVVSFHRKHFTPANSILLIVGQVNRKSFRERIVAETTPWSQWKGDLPKHDWKAFSDHRLSEQRKGIIVVDRPKLNQAQVRIGFRAPLIQASDHYSLVVANAMLGEYFNSRLNSLIRDKLGLTYSISSGFDYSRDFATFTISSATENASVGQLVKKIIEVFEGLKRGPIPSDELRMAKEYLVGSFSVQTASLSSLASRWLSAYVFDLEPNYFDQYIPKVNQITSGDVVVALNQHFRPEEMSVVVAGDAQQMIQSLEKTVKNFGPIRRVTLKDLL